MAYSRQVVVDIAMQFNGAKKGDARHKRIVDEYNKIKGVPKMNYTAPYCATSVSAFYHIAGYDDIFPSHCSCGSMIDKAKKMGCWQERDDYAPLLADCIVYDWDDDGVGDDTVGHDHVGIVVSTKGNDFEVIEGNKGSNHVVGIRKMKVNGKNIRGFVTPKFGTETKPSTTPSTTRRTLTVGCVGDDVKELHKELKKHFYGVSESNNTYNQLTKACVIHFQTVNHLKVDGIVGKETYKALGMM